MQQFTSLHLTVVFIPHHLLMIQLKQLADFVLIEIMPLEGVLDYHKKLLIGLLLGVGNYEINYNIEIRMYNFSRKLVVFFIIFFAQSSLGTNALQSSGQSFGQNGYVKFSSGLLIQWGKKTSGGSYQGTIYFPVSFYNSYYSLCIGPAKGNVVDNSSWIANYTANKVGSFNYINTYSMNGSNNTSSAEFSWFAIGRWK